jgi:hypothetical protein
MKILSSGPGRLVLAVVILAGLCLVGMVVGQDSKKPNVVEVDLSKLPPDVAKKLLEALKTTEEVKPISLTEAIQFAEKAGKGRAIQAEQDGDGAETTFALTLVSSDGTKKQITLDARGKVLEQKAAGKSGPPAGKGPPPGKGLGNKKKQPELAPKPDEVKK